MVHLKKNILIKHKKKKNDIFVEIKRLKAEV